MIGGPHQPRFLTAGQVLVLHQLGLMEFGGLSGVRDSQGLASAIAQPEAGTSAGYLHTYPFGMAAAYCFHLAKNHPFLDGNKRVAWSAMRVFLHQAGFLLRVPVEDAVDVMTRVITGHYSKADVEEWIEQHATQRPPEADANDGSTTS